jgi:hypothetical protein
MFVVNEVVKSVNDATQFLCYKNYFSIFKKKLQKEKRILRDYGDSKVKVVSFKIHSTSTNFLIVYIDHSLREKCNFNLAY